LRNLPRARPSCRESRQSAASRAARTSNLPFLLYGYRSFVAPEWRLGTVGIEIAKRITYHPDTEFVTGRATECIGIYMVLENAELTRAWNLAIDPRLPYVFIGTNERGNHIRVYYFEGAELAPRPPTAAS